MIYVLCSIHPRRPTTRHVSTILKGNFFQKKVAGHLLGLCAPFRLYYPFVVDCYDVSRMVLFRLLKQSKLGILAVPVRDVEIAKLLALFHSFYSALTSYNLFWGVAFSCCKHLMVNRSFGCCSHNCHHKSNPGPRRDKIAMTRDWRRCRASDTHLGSMV